MKGLELLEKYEDKYTFASQFNGDRLPDYQTRKMLEPIKKELKALEIIKNKQVSIRALEQCIKNKCSYPSLTLDEINLLKEVLNND